MQRRKPADRVFGNVDEYGGEFAATEFYRLWRLPLIPTGSIWISSDQFGERARPIKLHLRSVMAGYLRTWVPLLWWISFAVDSAIGYTVAAAALVAYCWTWSWRMTHRSQTLRQSDFDLVALGTQCPPSRMKVDELNQLLTQQKRKFDRMDTKRNPDDIARFGSSDASELITAYGILRVHAALTSKSAAVAHSAALRITKGRHEQSSDDQGAFRSMGQNHAGDILGPDQLAVIVAQQATTLRAETTLRSAHAAKSFAQKVIWGGWHQVIGYTALALCLFSGVSSVNSISDPDSYELISESILRHTIGDGKTQYRVECEEWIEFAIAAELIVDDVGDVRLCRVGKKLLPVLSKDGEGIRGNIVRGRLQSRHIDKFMTDWERMLVRSDELEVRTFQVFLVTDVLSHVGQILLAAAFILGPLSLFAVWLRVRRQRKRMLMAAMAAV